MSSLRLALSFAMLTTLACAGPEPQTAPAADPSSDQAEPAAVQPAEVEPAADQAEPAADPAEPGEALCDLGESTETWKACVGQRVSIDGRVAEQVMQHPSIAGFHPDGTTEHESYMDTDGAQIILVSEAAPSCSGEMTVVGSLKYIDLGGEPGTKDSYTGWALEGAEITCR